MAKIALSDTTFTAVPEGTHIFQITAVNYKVDFGKLEITMKTKQGLTHTERFAFVKANGESNDVAIGIFSFFAKTALQNFDLEEIDHTELVGRFIKCDVTQEKVPKKDDPTKFMTFSRLGNKYPADSFEDDDDGGESVATPAPAKKTSPTTSAPVAGKKRVDLSSILGKK